MMISLSKITHKGKALYLAYDQGLEHGPESDFDDKNIDPLYILDITKRGKFNAVVFHKGVIEKYYREIKSSKVPVIYKLNGKTRLSSGEPLSAQIATVKEAKKAGAAAVGYTIYIGSEFEAKMIERFGKIQREAHKEKLPVIVWMYPRGKKIKNDTSREMMAYATRVALEIGADMVKIKYGGQKKDLAWAVKSAGRVKVVIAGGVKKKGDKFLQDVKDIMKAGASGLAVGRNVWQAKEPLKIARELRRTIWE